RYVLGASLLIGLQLLALAYAQKAHAEINVSYVNLQKSNTYASQRTYAGSVVAMRTAELGFKRGGQVAQMAVDVGDVIQPGQVLATLDSRTLKAAVQQAEADLALALANQVAAQAEVDLAQNTERRFRRLLEQGHTPKQTYDETRLTLRTRLASLSVSKASVLRAEAALQARQVELSEATIEAPFAGIIQTRSVDEGTQINPGQMVLRLVERSRTEAHVGVPTQLAGQLQSGATFQLRWNNQTYDAVLNAVLPEVDPTTRTLTAVLHLKDQNVPLGAVVEMVVDEAIPEAGFWLPISALTASDRGLWGVYVINADNTIERRLIDVVHTEAERVFARGTLAANERVVRTGVQRIVPGQQVTPIEYRG
ncbi:MAG: efflux RND transporter periplasmic adaptor subunit, partial [Pseudomonadota bacterium]